MLQIVVKYHSNAKKKKKKKKRKGRYIQKNPITMPFLCEGPPWNQLL